MSGLYLGYPLYALTSMVFSLVSQDVSLLLDVAEKISEAEVLEADYVAKAKALGDKYGIEFNSED